MKPDNPSHVWSVYLFATNTGELYANHRKMASDRRSIGAWCDWIHGVILPRYRREAHEANFVMSENDKMILAWDLREYYENHNREISNG